MGVSHLVDPYLGVFETCVWSTCGVARLLSSALWLGLKLAFGVGHPYGGTFMSALGVPKPWGMLLWATWALLVWMAMALVAVCVAHKRPLVLFVRGLCLEAKFASILFASGRFIVTVVGVPALAWPFFGATMVTVAICVVQKRPFILRLFPFLVNVLQICFMFTIVAVGVLFRVLWFVAEGETYKWVTEFVTILFTGLWISHVIQFAAALFLSG